RGGAAHRGRSAPPDPGVGRRSGGRRRRAPLAPPLPPPAPPRVLAADRRGPAMSEVRRRNVLLRNRMFRRLWTARAISFIGDGIAITPLLLHVGSTNGTGAARGAL